MCLYYIPFVLSLYDYKVFFDEIFAKTYIHISITLLGTYQWGSETISISLRFIITSGYEVIKHDWITIEVLLFPESNKENRALIWFTCRHAFAMGKIYL